METNNEISWNDRMELALQYSQDGVSFNRDEMYDVAKKAKLRGYAKDKSNNIIWFDCFENKFYLTSNPNLFDKFRAPLYRLCFFFALKSLE